MDARVRMVGVMFAVRGRITRFVTTDQDRCLYVSGADRYQERTLSLSPRPNNVGHGIVTEPTTQYWCNEAGQVLRETSPARSRAALRIRRRRPADGDALGYPGRPSRTSMTNKVD